MRKKRIIRFKIGNAVKKIQPPTISMPESWTGFRRKSPRHPNISHIEDTDSFTLFELNSYLCNFLAISVRLFPRLVKIRNVTIEFRIAQSVGFG